MSSLDSSLTMPVKWCLSSCISLYKKTLLPYPFPVIVIIVKRQASYFAMSSCGQEILFDMASY